MKLLECIRRLAPSRRSERVEFQDGESRLQLGRAIAERNELQRQLDIAIGERDEILRQRDVAIGQLNLQKERVARHVHRADMAARRGVSGAAPATPDRLLFFLHLGKTGGVTLAEILARNFSDDEYLRINLADVGRLALGTWSHRSVTQALGRLDLEAAARLRGVWGHYRFDVQELLPRPCAVVTLLRDPVDRVISAFFYGTQERPQEMAATLEDYATRKRHYDLHIDNYMTRVLAGSDALNPDSRDATTGNWPRLTAGDFALAAANLDRCMLVGTTDRFDETLLILGSDLQWSLSDLVYARRNVTASRPLVSEVSQSIRDAIVRWNEYDAELVERGRAHLACRIAVYPGDFQGHLALFRELNALFQQGAPVEDLRRMERQGRS